MQNLQNKISKLPKELQVHISMFNYEHRNMMKIVCEQLEKIECNNCYDNILKKDAFQNTIMWEKYYYCSDWCLSDHEYDVRKSVKQFIRDYPEEYSQYIKNIKK